MNFDQKVLYCGLRAGARVSSSSPVLDDTYTNAANLHSDGRRSKRREVDRPDVVEEGGSARLEQTKGVACDQSAERVCGNPARRVSSDR